MKKAKAVRHAKNAGLFGFAGILLYALTAALAGTSNPNGTDEDEKTKSLPESTESAAESK